MTKNFHLLILCHKGLTKRKSNMAAPIKLTIYNPETHESVKDLQTSLVPWGILKRAMRLAKHLGGISNLSNPMEVLASLEEDAIDELTGLVADVFPGKVTLEELNEGTEIGEMVTVLQAVVARAFGEFGAQDPANPTPAAKRAAATKAPGKRR